MFCIFATSQLLCILLYQMGAVRDDRVLFERAADHSVLAGLAW